MPDNQVKSLIVAASAGLAGGTLAGLSTVFGLTSAELAWPVMAVCAVTGGLIHNAKHSITAMVDNRTATLRSRVESLQRDVGDIHGLVRLQPYTQALPLPLGGGWALRGDSAVILVREALLRRPSTALELGSGASTLLLGQILRDHGGGRLLSIDHDPVWAERTRKNLRFLGLDDHVTVVDAPLKRLEIDGQLFDWYDIPQDSLSWLGPIDLLLVDGPGLAPEHSEASRYPALPLLRDRLAVNALIFVDDASRPSSVSMLKRWEAENPGWITEHFDTGDGVCLLSRS